jgi:hypothetical protein
MPRLQSFLLVILHLLPQCQTGGIHLPLLRGGARFARHEDANMTRLANCLSWVEQRYTKTYRDIENNGLARRWRSLGDPLDDDSLLASSEDKGAWYVFYSFGPQYVLTMTRFASIEVGTPPQALQFDIDMLSPDFYTVVTTSEGGSRYDTFLSSTHGMSNLFPTAVQSLT